MNQDSSFQVISFPKALASGNENGGKRGERGGGGEEGGGRVWLILILFFISFQYRDCSKRNQVRTISSNAMADTNM